MGSRVKNKTSAISEVVMPLRALFSRLSFFILLVASVSAIFIGRSDRDAMERMRANVVDAVVPLLDVLSSPIKAYNAAKLSINEMVFVYEENKELRQENDRLSRIQGMAEKLEIENRRLKELLRFAPDATVSYVSARIVTSTSGPYARTAIIGSGEKNRDIKKGSVVVNQDGLVGRVAEVGDNSSRIMLITDINSRIPVVTSVSGEKGILSGNNTETLLLEHLPIDTKVHAGEKLVTAGDGNFFPPGIPVGVVQSVTSKDITVKPYVSWSRLEYVSVANYKPLE